MAGTEINGRKPEIEALRKLTHLVDQTRVNLIQDLQAAIDARKELLKRVAKPE